MKINNSEIEINSDFEKALELMEMPVGNVFITGRAGTGKSTLLELYRETTKKNVAVLAPTGVAAVNVRGQTIHSFFGFKPDITLQTVKKSYKNKGKNGLYKNLDAIVIDEISMVRADLMDCVDEFLRLNAKSGKLPFGGVKMIFIGDLFQLPPVVTGEERQMFKEVYESPYFFSAKVFDPTLFELVELNKVYRQNDNKFIEILNAVRNRSIDDAGLQRLNTRVDANFDPNASEMFIHLTTTNRMAEEVNNREIAKLPGKLYHLEGELWGNFDTRSMPAPLNLTLKIGSQVMLTNNDRAGRWVNGTIGKVTEIKRDKKTEEEVVWVELNDGEVVDVGPNTWEMFRFSFDQRRSRLESETTGSYTQYPLILAWAVTIHKSQGKTFNKVVIDLGSGSFAHGQSYVALSRCTSLEGIVLKRPVEKRDILMDWKVVKFLTSWQYGMAEEEMSLESKVKLIEEAIENQVDLEMVYLKSDNTKSTRKITPYRVGKMSYQSVEYIGVEGYCQVRGEDRVFRVDRILELKVGKLK